MYGANDQQYNVAYVNVAASHSSDDCDEDELKLGIIVCACLAGASVLLSLIMLCCMCNIKQRMSGKVATSFTVAT